MEEVCPQNKTYFEHFACYDGNGNWGFGIKTLPAGMIGPGYTLLRVNLTLFGKFVWKTNDSALVSLQLQDELIYQGRLPRDGKNFENSCANCVSTWSIVVDAANWITGWEGWSHSSPNNFYNIVAAGDMCLSQVVLQLFYARALPIIEHVFPMGGPNSGDTTLTLTGHNFDSSNNMSCVFGSDVRVPAVVASDGSGITCVTPPRSAFKNSTEFVDIDNFAGIELDLEVNGLSINTTMSFFYYPDPVVKSMTPTFSNSNQPTWVTFYGSGFVYDDNFAIYPRCKFGDRVSTNMTFINSTTFMCLTIAGPASDAPVLLSFNGQQFCAINMTFSFVTGFNNGDTLAWAIVAIAVLLVVSGVSLVICLARRNKYGRDMSLQPHTRLVNETSPLLTDSLRAILDIDDFSKELKISEIQWGKRIGRGSFGEVYSATWRGTNVAVKKLSVHNLDREVLKEIFREVTIMRGLRHPNVLQFLGACTEPPDVYIVIEFMPKGSLYQIIHDKTIALPWDRIRTIAIDAARGMSYLHNSDPIIIHRDLKSQNLLVDDNWRVKVCDFGLSRIYKDTQSTKMTACGTPCWTAPEVLRRNRYTVKADVYSFGVVLWEMITREEPFKGMPPFQVILLVGTQGQRPDIPNYCPPQYAQLIEDCWQEDPDKRPSFEDIITRLESF
jgi:tRNA A-37 threonylcarbamoyl transferase component Bud32